MDQKVELINIADLVLWTENPRDPIDVNASDQDIVDKALLDRHQKWKLRQFAKEMGDYYDFSELPTVVYVSGRPVVYDGNRRVILAKIKHGLVTASDFNLSLPDIPKTIPCNVCSIDVALKNVYRKHAESGSWDPLERDVFLYKFMGKDKSRFLMFDEATGGYIRSHRELNKRFVRDEVLSDKNLEDLGFSFEQEEVFSVHTVDEVKVILQDILEKVIKKKITTRTNRGDLLNVIDSRTRDIIFANEKKERFVLDINEESPQGPTSCESKKRIRTRRVKSREFQLFGKVLYLKAGDINNLYRDICEVYNYYVVNREKFSTSFISIIRMSLRLLCETASKDLGLNGIDAYIKQYASKAKGSLDKDSKTYLSNNNVSEVTLPQLLHTGAHNYSASRSFEQTLGISILLGAMLSQSHGKA